MKKSKFILGAALLSAAQLAQSQLFYYAPGLTQAKTAGIESFADVCAVNVESHPSAERALGALMADVNDRTVNPLTGNTWQWEVEKSGFAYVGEMLVEADVVYTFGKHFDDAARICIGGSEVLSNSGWNDWWTKSFQTNFSGWVEFDVRLYDDNGGKGPCGGDWGADLGLAFNTAGLESMEPKSTWRRLSDPGNMTLFRTKVYPASLTQPVLAVLPSFSHSDGTDFNASATLTFGQGGLFALAGFGGEYAATNLLSASPTAGVAVNGILSGLTTNTSYNVAAYAENSLGESALFESDDVVYAGEISLAFGRDAAEKGLEPGKVVVSRDASADATRLPLRVNYTVAPGTAVEGVNYAALAGFVTIPAGAASAEIAVTPLLDLGSTGSTSLSISLAPGLYICDVSVAQEIVIVQWVSGLETLGAQNISWTTAEITGSTLAAPADVVCYWGFSDGEYNAAAWDGSAAAVTIEDAGEFFVPLAGLLEGSNYWARLCVDDGVNEPEWSKASVSFTTLPLPVLRSVEIAFVPESSNFSSSVTTARVDIAQLGIAPILVFMWDEEDRGADVSQWTSVVTNFAPQAGVNAFEIPGLSLNDTRAWRAVVITEGGSSELSGEFEVAYVYNWVGPDNGEQLWRLEQNWDIGLVPNGPGASVVFPYGHRTVDIAGVGDSLTIGSLSVTVANWVDMRIVSSDGTPIIYDNGGLPARVKMLGDTWGNLVINAPQQFASETRVSTTTAENRYSAIFYGSSLTGAGPLLAEGGRIAFGADAGTTNLVQVPFDGQGYDAIGIRSAGTVLIKDSVGTFPVSGDWGGNPFVSGLAAEDLETRLVLSNVTFTDSSLHDLSSVFLNSNNRLDIIDGSTFNYSPCSTYIGGANNTLNVSGRSKFFLNRTFMNGMDSVLNIQDGSCVSIGADSFSFRHMYWAEPGANSLVQVSSALPGEPSIFDLKNHPLHINADACALRVLPGGIVTNVATLNIGNTSAFAEGGAGGGFGNRVYLEGGRIYCGNLRVLSGNALAPVLHPNGAILPIIAGIEAVFEEGSQIIVSNLDSTGGTVGRFPLVNAPLITTPPLADPGFFEGAPKFVCKLALVDEPDETQTLYLTCVKSGTLIIAR